MDPGYLDLDPIWCLLCHMIDINTTIVVVLYQHLADFRHHRILPTDEQLIFVRPVGTTDYPRTLHFCHAHFFICPHFTLLCILLITPSIDIQDDEILQVEPCCCCVRTKDRTEQWPRPQRLLERRGVQQIRGDTAHSRVFV